MNPFATLIDAIPLPYAEAVVATGAAMLGAVAGGVGTFTVLRRRSMFGDALSHGTLPGIVLAFLVVGGKNPVALLIGAVISALAAALLVVGLERVGFIAPDSAIGVVLSVFFSFGIVLLTHVAGTGNADQTGLDGYIFGQAAGMVLDDVILIACVIGAVCGAVGAVVAGRIDAPAGPVITLLAVLVALAATFFAPRRGVVTTALRRKRTGAAPGGVSATNEVIHGLR